MAQLIGCLYHHRGMKMKHDPIQALIDEWALGTSIHAPLFRRCLEIAHTEYHNCWQKIDKDRPETWPEDEQSVLYRVPLVKDFYQGIGWIDRDCSWLDEAGNDVGYECIGSWWRPLLPVDRPMEDLLMARPLNYLIANCCGFAPGTDGYCATCKDIQAMEDLITDLQSKLARVEGEIEKLRGTKFEAFAQRFERAISDTHLRENDCG